MPLYEFSCAICGPFDISLAAADSGRAVDCPACGAEARRVYSTPSISRMSAATRTAHARNEKSRHEPEVVHRPAGDGHGHQHAHAAGGRPWQLGH